MDYIEKIRKEKDITVTRLTEEVGISRDTYYKWLSKKRNINFEKACKLCEVLGISLEEFAKNFLKEN